MTNDQFTDAAWKEKKNHHQKNTPPKTNLVQNCGGYIFWPDLKCYETNGRNLITSSGFWVKSSSINESFISVISALQQIIKIQYISFVLKFPRLTGFA